MGWVNKKNLTQFSKQIHVFTPNLPTSLTNKVIKIRTNQGTLLVWILNSCCLNHDDVTWDSSKRESFGKQKEKEEKMRQGSFKEE